MVSSVTELIFHLAIKWAFFNYFICTIVTWLVRNGVKTVYCLLEP